MTTASGCAARQGAPAGPRAPLRSLRCPPPAAIMNSLKTYDSLGQTYYLAGPDVMTVAEQVGGLASGPGAACSAFTRHVPPVCWQRYRLKAQLRRWPRPPRRLSALPSLQVAFVFATIREKNTSLPMPAAAASLMARSWDWLGASTPLRGPTMFSSDYIAELQVGGGGVAACTLAAAGLWTVVCRAALAAAGHDSGDAGRPASRFEAKRCNPQRPSSTSWHRTCPPCPSRCQPHPTHHHHPPTCSHTRTPTHPSTRPCRATTPCPRGCWALSTWT